MNKGKKLVKRDKAQKLGETLVRVVQLLTPNEKRQLAGLRRAVKLLLKGTPKTESRAEAVVLIGVSATELKRLLKKTGSKRRGGPKVKEGEYLSSLTGIKRI